MNDEEELMLANNIVESILPQVKEMTLSGITPLICMLAEEWCKLYHVDVVSYMQGVADIVKQTNETEGPY